MSSPESSIPVFPGDPSGVTQREWDTWLYRGAACVLPDGRKCLVTKSSDGTALLVPVTVIR